MKLLPLVALTLVSLLATPVAAADGDLLWYRASLNIGDEQNPTREIPFLLGIANVQGASKGEIRNGAERIEIDVKRRGASLTIDFPHYDSRITANFDYHSTLVGEWRKTVRDGKERVLALFARHVPEPRNEFLFSAPGRPQKMERADFSGHWAMRFEEDGIAKGSFEQDLAGNLYGTIQPTFGDYRFLAGGVDGSRMRLSVFDGAHAFLFDGKLNAEGVLEGAFYSGNHWVDPFVAEKADSDFEMPDPFSLTSITSDDGKLHIDALNEPPYAGKPTIVTVFGTWCPNCNEEAMLLRELYEKHHDRGLQFLGIACEHTQDQARNEEQVRRFKERYDLPWKILVTNTSRKSEVAETLPDLSDVKSYPTTIFVNADGTVEAVHSGFNGAATGAAHEHLRDEFDRLVERILATYEPSS